MGEGRVRTLVLVLALAAVCGAFAAPAYADDNSVYQAYVSRDNDYAKYGRQTWNGLRAWYRSGRKAKKAKPVLRALSATAKVSTELIGALKREQPSSDHGKRAKGYAIACVRLLRQFAVTMAKGVRAGSHGHRKSSDKLIRAANRQLDRSGAKEKAARKEFKAAGVQIKPQ